MRSSFLGFLLVGIAILFSGLFGIYGGLKKNRCLIIIFVGVTVVFFIIAFAVAIAASLGKGELKDRLGT